MGILKEFKAFALRGNVMDLAVGVIIGGAFGKIVDSVVNDLIMPIVGIFFKADFSNLYIRLSDKISPGLPLAEAKKHGPVFAWGNFLTVALNFIILAFIIFFLIRAMNRLQKSTPPPPAAPSPTEQLLAEIRDELRNRPAASAH